MELEVIVALNVVLDVGVVAALAGVVGGITGKLGR